MKAIILARVSKEDQLEGQSIPAQLARSRQWCKDKKLVIKSEYQFDESSTKDQRKKFEKVIDEIRQSKEPIALVVETIDRLQRSFKESVMLDEFRKSGKLEIHFLREGLVVSDKSNSSELLRWDMGVMFARSYVLQLSDNVKRSIEGRLRNGQWIGRPRMGYMNITREDGTRDIVQDPERAHFIRKIFEYYIAGTSFNILAERMKKEGLRNTIGKPVRASGIHRILMDSFYYGIMVVKGKEYPHRYPPIIDRETFLRAQEKRTSWKKTPYKFKSKPYAFKGLIKCAICGCTITPEFKKDKYILYACTNYKKAHAKKDYVAEADLLKAVYKALKPLELPQDKIDRLVEDLRTYSEAKTIYHDEAIKTLDRKYMESQFRIDKLLDLLLASSITQDMYDTKFKKEKELQADILLQKEDHTNADKEFHITASTVLNLAKRATEIIMSSEPEEKRQFMSYLLQNCQLNGRKLDFTLRNPFNLIAKYSSYPTMQGHGD
ncbi:MAG: hypothetical protein A3J46_02400 [Candidatus Yanofskybacteria bacterium RIFCSPHIGHO2_02_FULL_41_11]|uniref:Recombinase domain-containing protein n=1 Tax=Candidatus Yanofskybacteria bacterium RIFCSPHIGHO2_02_FULL_41_11 TaxID=1802675 RepID=A0A1F8F8X0_9BACT|nr:MAG: hypothetical protein A3J46_02400 [Candidatus Yanofskybacteria bacterium RIFCSPHIGHO2_02_FULL_41_11]